MTLPDERISELSSAYVDWYAAADPTNATQAGLTAHETALTDWSPDALEANVDHTRAVVRDLDELAGVPDLTERTRVAIDVMREQLGAELAIHDAGESYRPLRVLGSPVSGTRECFDLMPTETNSEWERIAERMRHVPTSLASLTELLRQGLHHQHISEYRHVVGCAQQAQVWGGVAPHEGTPFFIALAEQYAARHDASTVLASELQNAADAATGAYAHLASFLLNEYAPHAPHTDGVGPQRYRAWARLFNGIDLDLEVTYAWGWEELARIENEMTRVAEQIRPGASVQATCDWLMHEDHAHRIEGVDAFRAWLQEIMDTAISELNGTHFDIPEPIQRVEAMIAPPGGAAAMYYTPPTEDFSRPGRTWYPTSGKTVFPTWHEVSTAYHEGVPGHHLQLAQVRFLADTLTRFQRVLAWSYGHGEGWALYAERLMGELGYLDDPAYELGMLRAHAFRAARVVVDIGLHCGMTVPAHSTIGANERWNADLALAFMLEHGRESEAFMRSEVDRYLGLPGQAISYKVGERVWLDARAEVQQRMGARFDLKRFHSAALDLGPMGLSQLRVELLRLADA
ncbi:MAG: DUF885 domain-containing protein [Acidimicrobiia bacterium]